MKTEEFVDILEQRQLVPFSVVRQLREKISKGDHRITAQSLLKYLVKKELLTHSQAKQLLQSTLTVSPSAESSILGIAELSKTLAEEVVPTLTPVDPASESTNIKETREAAEREAELASTSDFVAESLSTTEAVGKAGSHLQKKKAKKRGQQNEFDSPLLLLGGGGLIVLLLAGGIIFYLLSREDADAILGEASEFYDRGSYTQAVKQYDRFVTNFPRHPEFSAAKVKLGLAKIWKATSGTSQFSGALDVAKQVLDKIEDEKEFESAKSDLAVQLPSIAQGLAVQAEKATDPKEIIRFVAESKEALALCNNTKFIPSTYRDDVVLNEILETLDRVERAQEQKVELARALADIQGAIDAQDTATAYTIYKRLIRKNPGLLNVESLVEKVRAISAAEKGVVRFNAEARTAETVPRPSPLVAQLALAVRRGPAAGVNGVVPVRVDGAVYALNANDGKLLWREFVGLGVNLPPVRLPDGDLLVVDALHHELLRLKAETGKLVWRQLFEGPILPPVLADRRLLVTERAGKLHVLEAVSGESLGYVQFAQPLPVPPAVDLQGHRIYVVGDHSSVYTLSSDDYACLGVFFLGHASGSVAAPPVTVLNKVVVAEN
ncbi:MAG: PQQ-binding-like beta-propeller repeat protein, partial [Thermoguttaceae bacterium]